MWHKYYQGILSSTKWFVEKDSIRLQMIRIVMESLKNIDAGAFDGLTGLEDLVILIHSLRRTPDLRAVGHSLKGLLLRGSFGTFDIDHINLEPLVVLEKMVTIIWASRPFQKYQALCCYFTWTLSSSQQYINSVQHAQHFVLQSHNDTH